MAGAIARALIVPTADAMKDLGFAIGALCRSGDVILLSGDLGAGKTTFTQGLAEGMGIVDPVTSPTFVIARVHRRSGPGDAQPDLVHVDAYRLGSMLELDDLDLDSDLATAVVVVEWGGGLAEGLSSQRLELELLRSDDEADQTRRVNVVIHGRRWAGVVAEAGLDRWSA